MRVNAIRLGVALLLLTAAAPGVSAQRGRAGGPPQPPQSPQAAAPIDLTGYWVSIVNEDWRWRMVTPPKGDVASVPLNPEGRKVAESWDPSTDGSCMAFGAAGLMRMPTRLNITWENENTLKIETDNGQQTRRLVFDKSTPAPSQRSLQGFSLAEWERPNAGRGGRGGPPPGAPAPDGPRAGGPPAEAAAGGQAPGARTGGAPPGAAGVPAQNQRGGNLKVVTTRLSGGWLRRNGVPYSDQTTVTEYFDRFSVGEGEEWLVVTTIVSDPMYLNQDFVTSSHFRREPNGAKWDPTPCKPAS